MNSKYKVLISFFIFTTIALSSTYLFLPNYFQSLDNSVRDFYFRFRGPEKTNDNIVIIDIDEKSLKELGQWPWERDKVAQILTNLTNKKAGIIGLDIIFAEADKTSPQKLAKKWGLTSNNLPDYDYILSQTVASTPTILGYVFDFDKKNNKDAPQIPAIFIQKHKGEKEFLPIAKGVLTNINIIQDVAYSSGYINNIPDETGIIRSVPLMIKYHDIIYPSLAFEMFRIASNASKVTFNYSEAGIENVILSGQKIHTDRFAKLYLNFRGPFKSYKYISAVDVYNDKIKEKDIANKFILIGTSAYGLMDLRSTPMDSVIAGVEIHANLIDNLLNNDMLVKPTWAELADISSIIMGFVRLKYGSSLAYIDFFLAFTLSIGLVYLRVNKEKVEQMATIMMLLLYGLFVSIYILNIVQHTTFELFFLLLIASVFLKGSKFGFAVLIIIISTVIFIQVTDLAYMKHSNMDIFTFSVYLIALYFIMNLYRSLQNAQHKELEYLNNNLALLVKNKTDDLMLVNRRLKEEKEALKIMSATDQLTGLHNRTQLEEIFEYEKMQSIRYKKAFSIMMIDIDHFKDVNDTYGHHVGDIVLKEFTQILRKTFRDVDTLSRWGGEEFLILVPNTDLNGIKEVALRLRTAINNKKFSKAGHKTVSIGVTTLHKDDDFISIVKRSDTALYRAKNGGRDRIEVG